MIRKWKWAGAVFLAVFLLTAACALSASADTVVGASPGAGASAEQSGGGPAAAGPGQENGSQAGPAQGVAGPNTASAISYDNSFALAANFAMFFHTGGWGHWSPDNQRVYRTSTYPTAMKAVLVGAQPSEVSGTIQYQVYVTGEGWTGTTENGGVAGHESGTATLEAVRVWLNGDLAAGFDVYTMVMTGGIWGDWVLNGADAGAPGSGTRIDGVRIAVVKKGAQPADVAETAENAVHTAPVYAGTGTADGSKPMIALTFDDGPADYDNRILAALEAVGGRATFFMVGQNVGKHGDIIKRMVADGCELGNHSWSHPQLSKLSASEIRSQINRTNDAIAQFAGHGATVMRPPYGATNATVKSVFSEYGYASILWSIDTLDWKTKNTASTVSAVLDHVKDGDIILMHSIHAPTAAAVEQMVPELVRRGFQLVTVSELAAARGGMKPGTNIGALR